ncbi:hypothetical protein HanPI659440_Chr11g0411471 [Helianthus annuus]|nr:hypothetical protein HanPI659440_Chr11g0411471 [Helianthus annuus]
MNNRYHDDQERRLHADWHAGRPVVVDPQHVDYASLPPYDGSVSYPTPQLPHSQWIDPRQQEGAQQQQGGSSSGSFAFGEWNDMMSSIFGPRDRAVTSQVVFLPCIFCKYLFSLICLWLGGWVAYDCDVVFGLVLVGGVMF